MWELAASRSLPSRLDLSRRHLSVAELHGRPSSARKGSHRPFLSRTSSSHLESRGHVSCSNSASRQSWKCYRSWLGSLSREKPSQPLIWGNLSREKLPPLLWGHHVRFSDGRFTRWYLVSIFSLRIGRNFFNMGYTLCRWVRPWARPCNFISTTRRLVGWFWHRQLDSRWRCQGSHLDSPHEITRGNQENEASRLDSCLSLHSSQPSSISIMTSSWNISLPRFASTLLVSLVGVTKCGEIF